MENSQYYLKKSIPFEEDSIESVLQDCEKFISCMVEDQGIRFRLSFAVHELIINALEHGYGKTQGVISISMHKNTDNIHLEVIDEGIGIDPASLDLKNEVSSLEEAGKRGWGLHIIYNLFQGMEITSLAPHGTKVSLVLQM